jgi:hypothetical protein
MLFPFENRISLIIYAILWTLYATVHLLAMYFLVNVPFEALVADALIHALLFAGLGIIIRIILQYAKYETLPPVQQYANHTTLAVLIAGLWTGTGYLLNTFVLDETTAYEFVRTLPVRGMIGLMLYTICGLFFHVKIKQVEPDQPSRQPDIDPKPATDAETETETEIEENNILERIAVKNKQKIHLIPLDEIVYFQSFGDYVYIVTPSNKYLKEETMKYFETHLPKTFVRVHRSYIINIEYISRIESSGRRTQQVALKTGEWVNTSAIGYKTLKEILKL